MRNHTLDSAERRDIRRAITTLRGLEGLWSPALPEDPSPTDIAEDLEQWLDPPEDPGEVEVAPPELLIDTTRMAP